MEDKNLLSHEYDGIKELDNPLPGWWLATFYGTIVFSALYILYFHYMGGKSPIDEMNAEVAAINEQKQKSSNQNNIGSEALAAALASSEEKQKGHEIFEQRCVACHGKKGEGTIGPNLTDNFWLHGDGTPGEILKVVQNGVAEKGMPPWKGMLKDDEILAVLSYVVSLKGSNPPNGKAPQGNEYK